MAKPPPARGWDKIEGLRKRPIRTGKRSAPAGKRRLLIKERTENEIREIIENWKEPPRFSWDAVMAVVNEKYKGNWTYQALAKHPKLQKAFSDTWDKLRAARKKGGEEQPRPEGDGTIEVLLKQVRSLKEENEKLRSTNAKLEEKFVRWETNAYLNGLSLKELDKKLPKPDRGQTDKKR
jgi:hypothetical protein